MDTTTNLALPYIVAAQAQKHVTHNEALRALDALVQLMVLDKDLSAPPGSPAEGARYIVAASPTGAWAGQAGKVAAYQDSAWAFYAAREGWLAWVADEDKAYIWSGAAWGELAASPGSGAALWGVNGTADTTNRLVVRSTASLFDNVGNGHQLKLNKAAAGDTASTLYQTNSSGRAELGLAGDDDLHVKVSPDGSAWHEAVIVDRTTGAARFPNTGYLDLPAGSAPSTPASGKVRLYAKTDKSFYQKDDAGTETGLAGSGAGGGVGPNLLINPDGGIDQRNGGAAATTADDAYGAPDRWYSLTQTASIQVQRQADGENGMPFFQRLTQTQASAQRMGRAQIVESAHCKHLRGQSATLSGRIRCSASQAIRYALLEWTGTADSVTSDVVNDWTSATFTPGNFFLGSNLNVLATGAVTPGAATWTDLAAITGACGSSLNNLVVAIWTEGTAAQNVTLDLRLKLEQGATATAHRPRTLAEELPLCQRYFQKSFALDTAPAQNAGSNIGEHQALSAIGASASHRGSMHYYPVRMRADPTLTLYNPLAANAQARDLQAGADCSSTTVQMNRASAFRISCVTAAGTAAGNVLAFHWSAEAEL